MSEIAAVLALLWGIAGTMLLALLVALAVLLLMPVCLSASVQTSPRLSYRIDARLLGDWTPRISLVDSERPPRTSGKASRAQTTPQQAQDAGRPSGDHPPGKKPEATRKGGPGRARVARMLGALPQLLGDLARSIQWDSLHLDAEFGLGDPADTGQVYGCLTPLQYGVPWPPGVSIALRPNFERPGLSGELQATLRLRAAALLPPAARFAWRTFGPKA